SDNVRARLRELAALGADARYARTDVGDGEAVAALVASIQREHGALHGIFHCAGIADRTPLVTSTRADIDRVLRSKLHGTLHLDRATRALPLEVFVLFSSIAALVGDFGAGSYAAANFFLDRFAEAREEARRRGLRAGQTISVNWPLWQDGGMKMKDEDRALYFDFSGMSALDEDEGLAAFEVALRTGQPQLVVAAGDAQKIDRILQVVPSLATPATPAAATATPTTASAVLATASTSAAAPVAGGGDLRARTGAYLRQLLADATKLPVDSIQPDRALEVYGISSLLIMDLNAMLEKDFESLPRTLFFEYRSLDELAAYFVEEHRERLEVVLAPTAPAQPAPAAPPPAQPPAPLRIAPSTSAADAGIAIIGFGGRFPKAGNPDAFWDLLRNGVDAITEIPADRWDWRDYHDDTPGTPGRSYCKFGGFVDDFDRFDPLFFRLPPRTAESMDPQERLLLEVVWETVERAGYTVERLRRGRAETGSGRNRVGVFAGVMWGDYARHGHDEHHKGNPVIASADYSSIANRISYVLDLHGPSLALDTACSSSLVAVHLACESLLRGECQYAIAGGVSLSLHPAKYLQMSDLKALSAEGKCRSFGEGGKGYVPGEGAGALLLKPLRQAIADGDYIHGVLKGTAVNHDGKTNGYTVPNPGAQAEVVSAALQRANIDARTISYVEAHGTGTELGDPIEVTGLTKSYRQHTADRQYCALGSAKSNIGHLEGAAGVTGIIKVLLQLQHQQIAPSLHSQRLNPNIDFARSPFRVNQALTAWDRPRVGDREVPRRAGVSSFGAGGTNAHVIVEEFENAPRSAGGGAALIVLSAKDGDRLRAYAARLADGLRHQDADGRAEYRDLARVAHTLQTGREAMDARLAIVADDQRQLIADLEAFADGGPTAARVVTGHVKPYQLPALDDATRAAIDVACQRRDHRAIAAHWIAGHTIDWTRLYDAAPHPLVLPTYPFARDRYWIPVVPRPAPPVAALHPLVDRNVSTLEAVAFERTFRRDDAILRDHAVAGRAVLPGVAYLEMARAAGELAGPGAVTAIEDIAWIQPIVVDDQPVTVTVALRTDRQGIAYQMTSRTADRVTQHGQGRLRFEPASAPRTIALAEVIARCPRAIAA
ncbi:MAG TPA: SDR family oxidoreductase, partial [Kofleriaceae bacterium]|nr:SDR family oxidoreductase [Kofleriaceae bacterium]